MIWYMKGKHQMTGRVEFCSMSSLILTNLARLAWFSAWQIGEYCASSPAEYSEISWHLLDVYNYHHRICSFCACANGRLNPTHQSC